MVLLIVDTQKMITTRKLYDFDNFVSSVKRLIEQARKHQVEVIYVRHDDEEELTKGKEGFEIYEDFKPLASERIFDKTVNSPFHETGLLEYLASKKETQVMVAGIQTDLCIDATVKCGFEHGLEIFVPAHANTTVDNKHMSGEESYLYYNEFIWNVRYAHCMPLEAALAKMEQA